ncbi:MAG: response regulator [Candidatus Levybacteria bacterium]|nr:response regulator [Candidatus Levybacteria bacterium]
MNDFLGKNKVFIIDDDTSILQVMEEMIREEDYEVKIFTNGKDAIEKAKEDEPDIVILDYFLPGENAAEIVSKLRSIAGDKLPILLISASMQAKLMAEKLAVNEFIPKPFQREILFEAIRKNIS